MRIVLGLLVWLTLAAIGIASAGFWGFLGVAFLYVAYYGLLRPRVMVHVTAQEIEQQRAIDAASAAITIDSVATKLSSFSATPASAAQTGATPVIGPQPAVREKPDVVRKMKAPLLERGTRARVPLVGSLRSQVDEKSGTWVCLCGKRNAFQKLRCPRCNGWSPQ
jgi:hypothetical protein